MTRDERPADPSTSDPPPPPVDDRASLQQALADCRRLVQASPAGLITLDKTGLIVSANARAADMLGADAAALPKKPISLFIAPDDQALFFIHRSRIASGVQKAPLEMNFRRSDGTLLAVRMHAQPIETPGQQLPGMLLAVEDLSAFRQAMEALQFKEDCLSLLFSIIDDLAAWSAGDIDEIIGHALEKMGLVSGADRVYVCLLHTRRSRLSITHEWIGEGIDSPASALQDAPVDAFLKVMAKLRHRRPVRIVDVDALPAAERASHEGFHAAGARSVLLTPLTFGRYLLGVIGCDAVRQPVDWTRETEGVSRCIGDAIVGALLRRQAEQAPVDVRQTLLRFVGPPGPGDGNDILEYDGPVEVVDDHAPAADREASAWRFVEERPEDPAQVATVLLKGGRTANLACKHCNRQKLLDIAEIRTLGTQLRATCACGQSMYVKIELRREHRKAVNLDGVYIRGPGDRLAPKSDDWGRIQVRNLSRRGIAFTVVGKPDLRVDDRFRVKFTLNNTAGSIIHKQVVVRSIVDEVVGCQFEGHDPCDVTLGFYMMT